MTVTAEDVGKLFGPFAERDVHWRAQSVTKDGSKAKALAYIDARNVMERLDTVLGPANWEDSYHETEKGRLLCTLRINIEGVWIAKSDGAGDSDIEGEKGAISGAFKRAAVKWGIGRYLYDMPCPWVPCDSYEYDDRGKKKFRWTAWKDDPWKHVKGAPKPDPVPAKRTGTTLPAAVQDLLDDVRVRDTQAALRELWVNKGETASQGPHGSIIKDAYNKRKAAIELMDGVN